MIVSPLMEPVRGIEPRSSDYKTAALPLSYTGMVAGVGVAPTSPAYETGVLLLDYPAMIGGDGGSRTPIVAVQKRCSSVELHPRIGGAGWDRTTISGSSNQR